MSSAAPDSPPSEAPHRPAASSGGAPAGAEDSSTASSAPERERPAGSASAGEERTRDPGAENANGAAALPDRFADGTMQRLEPSIRTIWTLKLGAGLLLLVGAVFFYEGVQWLSGTAGRWPFVFSAAVAVVAVGITVAVPRLRYRYWRYALRTEELYLERGIFNRVRTVVPLRRIQHVDVSQDLFEREFNLGKLVVHTAGGRSSDVAVPGLRYETAERLRDNVKHYVLDDTL